jgi:hypothetical protein
MSIPAKMDESKDLEYLDTDWKLATVYTAFLHQKTQQNAIRLIYKRSKKRDEKILDIKNPANWIINARKELMDEGYLIKTDNKLRDSVIKADIEPIIQSLIAADVIHRQGPEVQEGVRLVLDSDWFRNFFSDGFLNNPITYRNGTIYEPYREITKQNPSWSHLKIIDLKNRLFQLLSEIGYYSHNIRWVLYNVDEYIGGTSFSLRDDALLKELLTSRNFDSMLKNNSNRVPPSFIKIYYSCIENTQNIDDIYPERLFNELLNRYAGLFIPIPVSTLMEDCPYKSSVKRMTTAYFLKNFFGIWDRDKRNNPT